MRAIRQPLSRVQLGLLLLLCTVVYSLFVGSFARTVITADDGHYIHYAVNLAQTGTYGLEAGIADPHREWGYGVFLSVFAKMVQFIRGSGIYNTASLAYWSSVFSHCQAAFSLLWIVSIGFLLRRRALPQRIVWIWMALLALSPTFLNMRSLIYSETLAADMIFGIMAGTLLVSKGDRKVGIPLATVCFAILVVTKSHMKFLIPLFFLVALGAAVLVKFLEKSTRVPIAQAPGYRHLKALLPVFLAMAIAGAVTQGWWTYRIHYLGEEKAERLRATITIAGKIVRASKLHFPQDLLPGILDSVGHQTCEQLYGPERCRMLSWLGAGDVITPYMAAAGDQVYSKAIKLYLTTIPNQLIVSGLEVLRMCFFEAPGQSEIGILNLASKLWHLFGSLLIIALAVIGWRSARIPGTAQWLGLGILIYHALVLSQGSNVSRYIFPLIPIIYFFAAYGIATVLDRQLRAEVK